MADKSLTLSCAQSGTSFTTKLNDALEAVNTMRSGPSEPTHNLEDGVMWLDTSGADKVIKIRIGGVFHPLLDFDGSNWYAERAETSTKLTTARDITLTGKVTGTASFDGTANATIATTLDTSGTWTGTATTATSAATASTATKLTTARTITLGTDLSGNVNFDGGTNVTLNATLDANTVGDSELAAGGTLITDYVLTGTGSDTFAWKEAAGGLAALSGEGNQSVNQTAGTTVWDYVAAGEPQVVFVALLGAGGGGKGSGGYGGKPGGSGGVGALRYQRIVPTGDLSIIVRDGGNGSRYNANVGGATTVETANGAVVATANGGVVGNNAGNNNVAIPGNTSPSQSDDGQALVSTLGISAGVGGNGGTNSAGNGGPGSFRIIW